MNVKRYIAQRSKALGLDPIAVLAVANAEGGFSGAIGDGGTSFGPFQLHMGGALPSSISARGAYYAQAWANSKAGIDYALNQIAGVAKGLKGQKAVNAIVLRFERPANPAHDLAALGNMAASAGMKLGQFLNDTTASAPSRMKSIGDNMFPQFDSQIPGYNLPGQGPQHDFSNPNTEVWRIIASQPNASPETQIYAQNAQVAAGANRTTIGTQSPHRGGPQAP